MRAVLFAGKGVNSTPGPQRPIIAPVPNRRIAAGETLSVGLSATTYDGSVPQWGLQAGHPDGMEIVGASGSSATLEWETELTETQTAYPVSVVVVDGGGRRSSPMTFSVEVLPPANSRVTITEFNPESPNPLTIPSTVVDWMHLGRENKDSVDQKDGATRLSAVSFTGNPNYFSTTNAALKPNFTWSDGTPAATATNLAKRLLFWALGTAGKEATFTVAQDATDSTDVFLYFGGRGDGNPSQALITISVVLEGITKSLAITLIGDTFVSKGAKITLPEGSGSATITATLTSTTGAMVVPTIIVGEGAPSTSLWSVDGTPVDDLTLYCLAYKEAVATFPDPPANATVRADGLPDAATFIDEGNGVGRLSYEAPATVSDSPHGIVTARLYTGETERASADLPVYLTANPPGVGAPTITGASQWTVVKAQVNTLTVSAAGDTPICSEVDSLPLHCTILDNLDNTATLEWEPPSDQADVTQTLVIRAVDAEGRRATHSISASIGATSAVYITYTGRVTKEHDDDTKALDLTNEGPNGWILSGPDTNNTGTVITKMAGGRACSREKTAGSWFSYVNEVAMCPKISWTNGAAPNVTRTDWKKCLFTNTPAAGQPTPKLRYIVDVGNVERAVKVALFAGNCSWKLTAWFNGTTSPMLTRSFTSEQFYSLVTLTVRGASANSELVIELERTGGENNFGSMGVAW